MLRAIAPQSATSTRSTGAGPPASVGTGDLHHSESGSEVNTPEGLSVVWLRGGPASRALSQAAVVVQRQGPSPRALLPPFHRHSPGPGHSAKGGDLEEAGASDTFRRGTPDLSRR